MVDELGNSHDWFHSISPLYGAKEKWFLIENHFSSARKVPHIELSPDSDPKTDSCSTLVHLEVFLACRVKQQMGEM